MNAQSGNGAGRPGDISGDASHLLTPGGLWRNWSGGVVGRPAAVAQPATEAEVQAVVRLAAERGLPVRVVGAGHSFTPAAETRGILVSLDRLSGIVRVDAASREVTVRAGTRLGELFELLESRGLALANQGDIDRQSIAGAISTGTHGTGLAFTGLAGMVRGMRLVTADGSVRVLSPDTHPEELDLARLSLGALGIITEVTLACVPAFDLVADESKRTYSEAVDGFLDRCREFDHTEFFWFPHTDSALVKVNTRLERGAASDARTLHPVGRWVDEEFIGNGVHRLVCELGRVAPALVPTINRISTDAVSGRRFRDRSHGVFVSPRRTRFNETEYAVPLEAGPELVREVRSLIERRRWTIDFPIEVRAAKGDDVPLSTAFERDSCYVAVHRFHRYPVNPYFKEFEALARAYGGRPHWGKMHSLDRTELATEYRRLDEFCALRDRLDPERRFQNAYTERVFGA